MNKSDLTKLQKFVDTDEKDIKEYKIFSEVYENNNLYAACDKYRMGIIFKDINNKDYYKYRDISKLDSFERLIQMLGQYVEDYKSYFTVNRKQLLNDLESKFKELKIAMRDEHAKFIHKKDVRLTLSVYSDSHELYYNLVTDEASSDSIKVDIDCKDEQHRSIFTICMNLEYFMGYLDFFADKFLTIKYSANNSPLVTETDNRTIMLLPIRINK